MGDIAIIAVLFVLAVIILVAEIFIPSHGILTIAGIAFLAVAVVKTFAHGERAGVLAMLAAAIVLPSAMILAVRIWPRTPLGRAIAPHNPVVSTRDLAVDVDAMHGMFGRLGRTLTPLRPVGTCEFDGRRFQCVAEIGMIEAGAPVQVVGIQGNSLTVAARPDARTA